VRFAKGELLRVTLGHHWTQALEPLYQFSARFPSKKPENSLKNGPQRAPSVRRDPAAEGGHEEQKNRRDRDFENDP